MNKKRSLATIAVLVAPMQLAFAQDASVNAQLAISDVSGYDSGMALVLGYELGLPTLPKNLSIEGEFTTSLSDPEYSYTIFGTTYSSEFSYYTLGGYMKYTLPVSPQFNAFGRAGLIYENIKVKGGYLGSGINGTGIELSLGIGADVKISQKMDLTAGFTIMDSNFNHLSAGIKYKL